MLRKTAYVPGAIKGANFDNGIVEAIVSVTGNVDYQKDVIVPGAFQKTLASGRLPKVVKAHNWDTWLGKTVDAAELRPGDRALPAAIRDKGWGGLYVKGQFTMEDPIAAGVYAHLKRGVIDEFSIGFDIASDEKGRKSERLKGDVREILSIFPLYEWSPVMMGANPATVPLAVKAPAGARRTDQDLQAVVARVAGMSRAEFERRSRAFREDEPPELTKCRHCGATLSGRALACFKCEEPTPREKARRARLLPEQRFDEDASALSRSLGISKGAAVALARSYAAEVRATLWEGSDPKSWAISRLRRGR